MAESCCHQSSEEFDTDDSGPPEDPDNYLDEGDYSFSERDNAVLYGGGSKAAVAQLLLTKSKKCAARFLKEECIRSDALNLLHTGLDDLVFTEVLNILLNPALDLRYSNTIKWLKWLLAGGSTPRDFYQKVEEFDNPTTCSLVWTADFMAYRCRTCGISPCMSLCLDCFNKGNHQGHDYNMFKSQAGGACDCGNRAVMSEAGFCSRHRGSSQKSDTSVGEPPSDLLLMAKLMMPRLLLRLILHCRSHGGNDFGIGDPIEEFEPFVTFLQELCRRGAAMRSIVTDTFRNPEIYKSYTEIRPGMRFYEDMVKCQKLYYEALESIPFGEVPPGYEDISTLHSPLVHTTFLEEILFWTLKFEFPQKLVCLLLNMRPDPDYEDAFARAFVQHYSRISVMLVKAEESDPLSHRVVHVSVQLFSDQKLAYKMTDSYHLLHVMVLSVKKMIKNISVPSTLHDMPENTHKVVNCTDDLMKNHSYWPLVSDLNNILSHELIAKKFMSDSRLLNEWFAFLSYFQGMNNNLRELNQHVEYEPQSYYAAFSAELEVSASPLWAMLSHMKDESTQKYTLTVLRHCLLELQTWFQEIGFRRPDRFHPNEATFHLPLHRTFSLLLCHAVKKQGVKLEEVLPSSELLTLMLVHPLRVQVAFHEIICNLWVRNGLQIKGQAMTYIQCHFCNSMFDPDLFLLQIGAGELPKDSFLMSIIERFHVLKYLSFSKQPPDEEPEAESNRFKMLESCLVFLAALMTNRHNLSLSEEEIAEKEIITLMCTYDKTHSRLMEYLPEKCASNPNIDFDQIVKKYTKYIEPECQKSGAMREGLYVPRDFVWEDHFDPVMTMTRCLHKKEYQNSLNRFKQYCRKSGKMSARKAKRLWPPYRLPGPVDPPYKDPRRILSCRTFHGVVFTLLYKALQDSSYTENMLSLSIHLLELAIDFQCKNQEGGNELASKDIPSRTAECPDGFFYLWYSTDDIFKNCTSVINLILLNNYLSFQPSTGGENSDIEMEEIEGCDPCLCLPPSTTGVPRPLPSGSEVVPYQDQASALVVSNVSSYRSQDMSSRDLESSQVGENRRHFHPRRNNALPSSTSGTCTDTSLLPSNYSETSLTKALVETSAVEESSNSVNLSTNRGSTGEYLNVNESLVTLLLKLHSKLSDRRGSYRPQFDTHSTDNRIGDGPFYISKVLNKLGQGSDEVKRYILESISKLYLETEEEVLTSSDEETSSRIREEKKKRAKEWQKKVMASFNRKQQKFMAKNMPDVVGEVEEMDEEEQVCEKEYDCVICNQSIPSTVKRPFGLIVYMQPSSVHGSRITSSKGFDLPINERTKVKLRHQRHTLARHMRNRTEIFNQYFDLHSWLSSMDLGWNSGVHVQTCGHHLHLDCHKAYVLSLQSQPIAQENGANYPKGEYFCPFCRQLSNSILPIFCESGVSSESSSSSGFDDHFVVEIDNALKNPQISSFTRILTAALYAVMDDLTKATPPKYRVLSITPEISLPSTFVYLSSIFRTNLEIELVQRGGSLVNQQDEPKVAIKRSSLVPLMHILAHHAKILVRSTSRSRSDAMRGGSIWIRLVWASLSQSSSPDFEGAITQNDREVPMLFKDPIAILLHMVLLLPATSLKRYYRSVVLNVYRLAVAKAAVSAIRSLPEDRRVAAIMNGPLAPLLSMAYNNLRDSPFFRCDQPSPYFTEESSSSAEFTCEIREACLEFLRIATILKAHLMEERLPTITDPLAECGTLERFLDLWDSCSVVNTSVMGKMCGTLIADNGISSNLNISFTPSGTPVETQVGELSGAIKIWCSQVSAFALKVPVLAASLLTNVRFFKPSLLNLPDSFDEVFKYYHKRKCSLCNSVPKDPGICLVCGTLVCMRQMCCNQEGMLEGVQHALECGAGTAIYLAVLQAAVIVVRHPRVCLWGCIHLDCYGEEDKDLKRGKPLYLSKGRYQLLQEQWLGHIFMHTPHKWVWHNNFI